jgi:hypothetical protein
MKKSTSEYYLLSEKVFNNAKRNKNVGKVHCCDEIPFDQKITQECKAVNTPNKSNIEIHIKLKEEDHMIIERYAEKHNVTLNEAYNAVVSTSLELFRKVYNYVSDIDSL